MTEVLGHKMYNARTTILSFFALHAGCASPTWQRVDAPADLSLSGVWGAATEDVFIVGGDDDGGAVLRGGADGFSEVEIPEVPLLVWVFGLSADEVYTVGTGGGALRWDGATWTRLDTGVTTDLWGIWGTASNDLWVVGEGPEGARSPTLLHYDGTTFEPVDVSAQAAASGADALFKVWGIGDKVFAVGQNGLILGYDGASWTAQATGASDDFVSLWGPSADQIVAVGGRSRGQVAVYDGTSWTTKMPQLPTDPPRPVPGLNAVFFDDEADGAFIGGLQGWVGGYAPADDRVRDDGAQSLEAVHAMWGDGAGRTFAVSANFFSPHKGDVLVRR